MSLESRSNAVMTRFRNTLRKAELRVWNINVGSANGKGLYTLHKGLAIRTGLPKAPITTLPMPFPELICSVESLSSPGVEARTTGNEAYLLLQWVSVPCSLWQQTFESEDAPTC
jgi:hypothetical protein